MLIFAWCVLFIPIQLMGVSLGAVFSPPREEGDGGDDALSNVPWHQNWDAVTKCKKGEKHMRFPECWCGQYAQIVPDTSAEDLESEGYHVKLRGNRKIHYVCLPCSSCPDGVRMTGYCRQAVDTSCDIGECIDPTYIFDNGRKACVPDPRTIEPKAGNDEEFKPDPTGAPDQTNKSNGLHLPVDNREKPGQMKSTWTEDQRFYILMVVVVAAATVVAISVVITVAFLAHRKYRRQRRYRTLNRNPINLSQVSVASNTTRCMACLQHETVV